MEIKKLIERKPFQALLAAGIGSFALVGCGSDGEQLTPNVPGVVVNHRYDDPDTWTGLMPAGRVMIPVTRHDPAHYYLDIEQCGHESFESEENREGCGIFLVEVSQRIYNEFQDGETITFTE